MKAVILTGNQANQKALCHKIAKVCDVSAIVVSQNIPRKRPTGWRRAQTFVNRINTRLFGRPFVEAWFQMLGDYEKKFLQFPDAPQIKVSNVNDEATLNALEKYQPHVVIVSGTNLVGKKVIQKANEQKGILNLHTGISPYIKGGPNCTNWCLAEKEFHLIGNTVMWLDAGIDTGNIIATEQTPLDGSESLFELHRKVMEHAHDLYVRVVQNLAAGETLPAVPQNSIAEGKTFYTADWNGTAMRRGLANFKKHYPAFFADAEQQAKLRGEVKFVSL